MFDQENGIETPAEKTKQFIEDAIDDEEINKNSISDIQKSQLNSIIPDTKSETTSDLIEKESTDETKEPEWQDILGSGVIMKKILKEGTPDTRPQRGQKCTINYLCKLEDETIVDTQHNFELNLGECDVIQGLDVSLGLMNVNERCVLKIQPRLAFGEKGLTPSIPRNVTVVYELELVSVQPEEDVENLSLQQRKVLGNKKRERGNWWYQRGENNLAIQCYRRALDYLDEVEGGISGPLSEGGEKKEEVTDSDLQLLLEDRISVYNNMAAAQIKMELYDAALLALQTVLQCQPDNVKALFRKAKVCLAKNDLNAAVKLLEKARQLQPSDAIIQKEISTVNALIQKQKNSEREYARRMFGGTKASNKNNEKEYTRSKFHVWATIGATFVVGLAGLIAYKSRYA